MFHREGRAILWRPPLEQSRCHAVTDRAFFAPYESIPFDDPAAAEYGSIRAQLAAAGTPIGPNDLMIAAIARERSLTLVTHNTREF